MDADADTTADVQRELLAAIRRLTDQIAVGPATLLRPDRAAAFLGVKLTKFNELVARPDGPKKRSLRGTPVYARADLEKYALKLKGA